MSDLWWMFAAFLAVWTGIGLYLLTISTRQRRLEHRIQTFTARDDDRKKRDADAMPTR